MSTKADPLLTNVKCHVVDESRFSNLNLNQNNQCKAGIPIQSYSKSNFNKNYGKTTKKFAKSAATTKTVKTVVENKQENESSQSCKKLMDNKCLKTINDLNLFDKEKTELKKHKMNTSSNANSSTLSLHIAAYENESNALNIKKENSQKKTTARKISKSALMLQNPFEYPRQMGDNDSNKPEIMQFKASQKLLSLNQAPSSRMAETEEEITPRQYQIKLAEHCIDNDAIAVLPTGSGKTLIAIMLMETLTSKTRKKSAFIVNKVINVEQQYEYIKKQCNLKVEKWHRKFTKNSTDFIKVIQENDVVIMTAEACRYGITHGLIKMNDFALVVIDECHHAMAKKHSCRYIVERIKEVKKVNQQQFPRFLGLTASGLNAKVIPHQLPRKFLELEITLGADVITSNEYLQDEHRNVVKETVFFTDTYEEKTTFEGLNTLEEFCLMYNEFSIDTESDPRKKIVECVRRAKTIFDECGIYCGYMVIKHDIIPHIEKMRDSGINSSDKYVIFSTALTVFCDIQTEMDSKLHNCNTYEQITAHLHPRVTKIIEVLEAYDSYQMQNGKRCAAIVFAEKCDTVMALALLLEKLMQLRPRPSFIKAAYAVGAGVQKLKFEGTDSEINNGSLVETLEKFRNDEVNCLVATQVLEEGIDIPKCNLVICTNLAPTFCSYIQSRGRARDSSSMLAYIVSREDRSKYIYNAHIFKSNEKFLLQRIANFKKIIPDHKKVFYDAHCDSLEEPYCVESTGASVKLSTAVCLLHQYCSKLPSDAYTPLFPRYQLKQVKWGYICEIELPSNCPLQIKIIGKGHMSWKFAYMSSALEACKILHKQGELDDNLVPLSKEKFAEKENFTFEADSGTTKKHRLYDKKIADIFTDNFISAEVPFWIYVIEMEVTEKVSDEFNPKKRKIMDDTPHVFGLCSSKPLPEIPTFPVFHKYGKYVTSVKLVPKQFTVSPIQLKTLQIFHAYAFEKILGISNQMVFNPNSAIFSTLVAPMQKSSNNYEINYEVAEKAINGFPSPLTEDQRKNFVYNGMDYRDAVVKPWYIDNEDRIYYVEEVSDKDLNSHLDGDESRTFKTYYKKNHKIDAYNLEQHLLDASVISKELNCLFPPHISTKSKTNMRKEYLVPEFVLLHQLPASYWLMLLRIPSVLYRINHLLLADELRQRIIKDISNSPRSEIFELDGLDYSYDNRATIKKLEELHLSEFAEGNIEENEIDEDDICDDYSDECFLSDTECSESKWNDNFLLDDMDDLSFDSSDLLKSSECEDLLKNNEMNTLEAALPLILPNDYYNNKYINERLTAPKLPTDFKIWSPQIRNSSFGVQPALLLQALTTTGACDGFNLERLETMGDSFLKLISTIYLYQRYSNQNEGRLTFLRSLQICNANLLNLGYQFGIPSLMVSRLFEPKFNWIPPCYNLQDKLDNRIEADTVLPKEISVDANYDHFLKQRMSDKSIADCVEALIGAHLMHLGAYSTIEFMKLLGLKVDISKDSVKAPIDSLAGRYQAHEAKQHVLSKYKQNSFEKLEETIGYSFRDKSFLIQAFIHLSSASPLGCYQRLEFLGDAVLDFLITQHLYNHNLKFSPGVLTDLRSALVNNINFASLVIKHGMHQYLIVENEKLSNSIVKFALLCEKKGDLNFHDMMELVVENDAREATIEQIEVPKALGDIFESLAGAVYLDSGMEIEVVWRVFYNLMKDVITKWCHNPPKSPIRELMEDYKNRIGPFEKGPKVNGKACILIKIDGKTTISGVGKSERLAKRSAAIEALKHFEKEKKQKSEN